MSLLTILVSDFKLQTPILQIPAQCIPCTHLKNAWLTKISRHDSNYALRPCKTRHLLHPQICPHLDGICYLSAGLVLFLRHSEGERGMENQVPPTWSKAAARIQFILEYPFINAIRKSCETGSLYYKRVNSLIWVSSFNLSA